MDGWLGGRAGEQARRWMDTTWPVVQFIAFNFTSAERAHRRHPVWESTKLFNRALRLTQNHTDKQTDKQTYIKNPDGQSGLDML